MQPTQPVWTEIDAAFRQWLAGDAPGARGRLEALAAAGWEHPFLDLGLAYTRRDLGDFEGAARAADAVLAAEPANLPAMIIKGDALAGRGEHREAMAYYATALKLPLPPDAAPGLKAEVARAAAAVKNHAMDVAKRIDAELAKAGVLEAAPERFRQSLAIMRGERRVYAQRPLKYFYPGLPLVEFYDRRDFPWVPALEASADAVREEVERVLADRSRLLPYVEDSGGPRVAGVDIAGSRAWTAFFLCRSGVTIEENAALCPRTMAALEDVPLARAAGATPSVLFSVLEPGAHIPPHNGMVNTRLICHLPVVVPDGCTLRVGAEQRDWRYGETLIFDDSIEHEAWNRSSQTRVVLLFDIWRPELSEVERRAVSAFLSAQARSDTELGSSAEEAWGQV
jgi:aspartyl/asparaginyl beta-hydroxylase (cupin superfamily)